MYVEERILPLRINEENKIGVKIENIFILFYGWGESALFFSFDQSFY